MNDDSDPGHESIKKIYLYIVYFPIFICNALSFYQV